MSAIESFANAFTTTLSGPMLVGDLSAGVVSAMPVGLQGGQFRIAIGTELLLVTAGEATTTWTVSRGVEGTTAAAHSTGAIITHVLTAASLLGVAGTFDVRAYGAKGDDATDDRAAIRAAVDAASDGDTILFPPGVYVLGSILGEINKALHFVGYGATLKAGANGMGGDGGAWAIPMVGASGVHIQNVSVRGLTFDCANRANTPIAMYYVDHIVIEDCYFTGYSYTYAYYATDSAIRLDRCLHVNISNVTVKDWLYGNSGTTKLHRAITIQGPCDFVNISGLSVENADQGTILGLGSAHIVIDGCTFSHLSDNGLYVLLDSTGLIVSDCEFYDSEEAIVLAGGIGDPDMTNVLITGCRFRGSTNKSIAVSGDTSRVSIVGNQFTNTSASQFISHRGPATAGVFSDWIITGNLFTGPVARWPCNFNTVNGMLFADNRMVVTFSVANPAFILVDGTATDFTLRDCMLNSTGGAYPGVVAFAATERLVIADLSLGASDNFGHPAGASVRGMNWAAGGAWAGPSPQSIGWATAAPTNGTWARGDIMYAISPASAGYIGWVCTVAGTPGTWKTFGLIS